MFFGGGFGAGGDVGWLGIGWAKVLKAAAAVMTGAAGGGGDGLTPAGTIEGSDFIAFANSCAADG